MNIKDLQMSTENQNIHILTENTSIITVTDYFTR